VTGRAPGVALALASMTTIQLGAALSEPLFDRVGAAGTVAPRARRGVGGARGRGVALLTLGNGAGEPLDAAGVAFAAVAAACWAAYILLTKRVGARWAGFEGLSVSLAVAAVVVLPLGIAGAGSELLAPAVLLSGIGLALLIPLLPYAFELVALRRLPTALFGVIMSLEPAIAALLGFLILDQALAVTGVVAIAMVSVASAGATLGAREAPDGPPSLGA
jgi:inner membrane transporter RhtA